MFLKGKNVARMSRSGRVVFRAVLATQTVVGLIPSLNLHQCLWTILQVLKKAWLLCWPLYSQQVSHHKWIWGPHKWESMQKGSTLALKPRADITRSPKQGYQWPHEKDLCPPKNKNKRMLQVWFKWFLSQPLLSYSRCNECTTDFECPDGEICNFCMCFPGTRGKGEHITLRKVFPKINKYVLADDFLLVSFAVIWS